VSVKGPPPSSRPWSGATPRLAPRARLSGVSCAETRHTPPTPRSPAAYSLVAGGKRRYTVAQIAAEFGVTRPTIYRYLSTPDAELATAAT
jgi:hypothetical protein